MADVWDYRGPLTATQVWSSLPDTVVLRDKAILAQHRAATGQGSIVAGAALAIRLTADSERHLRGLHSTSAAIVVITSSTSRLRSANGLARAAMATRGGGRIFMRCSRLGHGSATWPTIRDHGH